MELFFVFMLGFIFSFLGSIPPGSINLTVLQLSLNGRLRAGIIFGFAASLVEILYSYMAVKFEMIFLAETQFNNSVQVISSSVLLILGLVNYFGRTKEMKGNDSFSEGKAFRKGLIIGFFNPLAIPFWIACTAFLQAKGWLLLTEASIYPYILGIATGGFFFLFLLSWAAFRFRFLQTLGFPVNKMVGLVFFCLGIYGLTEVVLLYF